MASFLSVWPDCVPDKWRPSQNASSVAWILVVLLSVYIGADNTGMLEAWPWAAPCDGTHTLLDDIPADHLLPIDEIASKAEVYALRPPFASMEAVGGASSRMLEASNSASSGSSSSSHGEGHQHDALLFLFVSFILGTMLTHLMTFQKCADLQVTVVLFVLGVLYSLISEALSGHLGVLGRSYNMWMDVDPHLILFTLLPALLTADAMTLDTRVTRRVGKQCIYLATCGVITNAFLMALFLYWYLPYDWSFLLSLTTGAILCATDPVAVVALLKELGASPTLTLLIQGESLLNDGTAIVLYSICYNMLQGAHYDLADIIMILVKKAMCALGLGMLIGAVFLFWIFFAHNRFEHRCAFIQISLTLCCAYWSFIIAEGVFNISGVLANVAAALVLAHSMWPQVVDKESMHTVWHMLEFLANTLIFFLSGALTGKVMVTINAADYLHLLVIYVVVIIIRFLGLVFSRPILKRLSEDGKDISIAEIIVMTWGGLRGAVGLMLAIQVTVDRADGQVSEMDANRVLFFVGGIAALTLVINSTTCPRVVNSLGVAQLPETKKKLLLMLLKRLLLICHDPSITADVEGDLKTMLDEMEILAEEGQSEVSRMEESKLPWKSSNTNGSEKSEERRQRFSYDGLIANIRLNSKGSEAPVDDNLLDDLDRVKAVFEKVPKDHLQKTLESLGGGIEGCLDMLSSSEEKLREIVSKEAPEFQFQGGVIEAFLNIVRYSYTHDMEDGILEPGSFESEVLTSSVLYGNVNSDKDLCDWGYIHESLVAASREFAAAHGGEQKHKAPWAEEIQSATRGWSAGRTSSKVRISVQVKEPIDPGDLKPSFLSRLVASTAFNVIIMTTILGNSIFIFMEEEYRNPSDDKPHPIWIVSDVFFNVIFTMECIIKLVNSKHRYFQSPWNLFDFTLVILGLFGMVLNFMTSNKASGNTGVLRIARVFRVLRLVRLARLLQFLQVLKHLYEKEEETIAKVRKHNQRTTLFSSFIQAHLTARKEILDFFGTDVKDQCSVELARCILKSEISIYEAILQAALEDQLLSGSMLEQVRQVRCSNKIARELEHFIMEAHDCGIIGASEAHSIVHPLHDYVTKKCPKYLKLIHEEHRRISEKKEEFEDSVTKLEGDIDAHTLQIPGCPPTNPGVGINVVDMAGSSMAQVASTKSSQSLFTGVVATGSTAAPDTVSSCRTSVASATSMTTIPRGSVASATFDASNSAPISSMAPSMSAMTTDGAPKPFLIGEPDDPSTFMPGYVPTKEELS